MNDVLTARFAAENAEEPSGLAALGINGEAFVIQLITFLLVYFVLKKFVFARVVALLEKRNKTIDEGVKLSEEAKKRSQELDNEIAEAHKNARLEADKLLASTKSQADQIVRDAEESAAKKAENILVEAKKKITEETERARRALERDTVDLIIEATEVVSKEKLDAKKDSNLIKQALRSQS